MTDNLESMKIGELRQLMLAQGWSTATKGTKRSMIYLLRKYPNGPRGSRN